MAALAFLFLYTGVVRGQAPIAYNDTVMVVQFSTDTINLAAIDSSTGGDSLCLFKIYGSPNFALVNCNDVVYHPDTTFTGWDSCHYIICNAGDTLLCDTAVLAVNVTTYYRPMMLRNSRWVVETYDPNCFLNGTGFATNGFDTYVTFNSDTIINNNHYFAIYDIYHAYYEFECAGPYDGRLINWGNSFDTTLVAYIRQDTSAQKVFLLYPAVGHDSLFYDFSLVPGDTVFPGIPGLYTILQRIDSFQSGNSYYRRYNFSSSVVQYSQWIEGVGSVLGPFMPFYLIEAGGPQLLCFSNNDTTIYPSFSPDSVCPNGIFVGIQAIPPYANANLFPNPATNTVTITGLKPRTPIIITNLLGQVLINEMAEGNTQTLDISRLAAGMYFVNNMKLVKE